MPDTPTPPPTDPAPEDLDEDEYFRRYGQQAVPAEVLILVEVLDEDEYFRRYGLLAG